MSELLRIVQPDESFGHFDLLGILRLQVSGDVARVGLLESPGLPAP